MHSSVTPNHVHMKEEPASYVRIYAYNVHNSQPQSLIWSVGGC